MNHLLQLAMSEIWGHLTYFSFSLRSFRISLRLCSESALSLSNGASANSGRHSESLEYHNLVCLLHIFHQNWACEAAFGGTFSASTYTDVLQAEMVWLFLNFLQKKGKKGGALVSTKAKPSELLVPFINF